jgi:hypothetical protein
LISSCDILKIARDKNSIATINLMEEANHEPQNIKKFHAEIYFVEGSSLP